jgi:hypothetical protein
MLTPVLSALLLLRLHVMVSAGCVCAAVYEPVCGDDGQDYSNACEADCAGAQVLRKGPCSSSSLPAGSSDGSSADSCVCPMIYAPVCTKKGATRSNKCVAQCKGEKVAYEGPCKPKTTDGPIVDEKDAKDNVTARASATGTDAEANATAVDATDATAANLDAPGAAACVLACWFPNMALTLSHCRMLIACLCLACVLQLTSTVAAAYARQSVVLQQLCCCCLRADSWHF